MSTDAQVINPSRGHRRDVSSGDVTPRNQVFSAIASAPPQESEVDRVVSLFLGAKGCKVEDFGHRIFMCAWIGLSNAGQEEAGQTIGRAILTAINEPTTVRRAMLGPESSLELRVKTGGRIVQRMDPMEEWEELDSYARPWRTRNWGSPNDGIGAILNWIAEMQADLVAADPDLRDYLASQHTVTP